MHTRLIKKLFADAVDSKLSLRMAERFYRLFKNRTCEGLTAKAFIRYKKAANKKSAQRIEEEIRVCQRYWKCYPLHYFRYDLYLKEKDLSRRQLLNYIPEFFFYNLFVPYHDSIEKQYIVEDKIITDQIFRSIGVTVPDMLGSFFENQIYDPQFNPITYRQLLDQIRTHNPEKFLVKPVNSGGGKGIVVFKKTNGSEYIANERTEFDEAFLRQLDKNHNYLIQSGIRQVQSLNRIYPNSVNSLRIISENLAGQPRLLYGILRMGRSGNEIDNLSQKGIFAEIDMQSGTLSDYAVSKDCHYFYQHPDTGEGFKGKKIPNWKRIKETLLTWVGRTPHFNYLGWDIALTDDGPVVIEANIGFGLDSIQILSGGMREMFRIDDPAHYWNKRPKK